jgi:hypothetical protein
MTKWSNAYDCVLTKAGNFSKIMKEEIFMKRKILKKRLAAILMALVMSFMLMPMVALAEEAEIIEGVHIHGDACDHGIVDSDLSIAELSVGDVGVAPMNWSWTDCSNILGHSWLILDYSVIWAATPSGRCYGQKELRYSECQRTNCTKWMVEEKLSPGPTHSYTVTTVWENGVAWKISTCNTRLPASTHNSGTCGHTIKERAN